MSGNGKNRILFSLFSAGALFLVGACGIGLLPPPLPPAFTLGQADFAASFQNERTFISPGDMVRVGNKLIVSDFYGGKVLIWNTVPSSINDTPDLVLGKPSLKAGTNPTEFTVNARSLATAGGVATDGTRLVITDSDNHRVLIWLTFPTSSYQPADVVLGQPDFTTHDQNYGGLGPSSFDAPNTVGIEGGRLYVGDYANKRILGWNTIPTTNNALADFVIGQANFVSTDQACAANRFNIALQGRMTFSGGILYVADTSRVMVFDPVPTTTNPTAAFVIGKPNLTDCTIGTTANRTSYVYGVTVANGKAALADWGNNRVLIYNTVPIADNAAADVVLGQTTDVLAASPGCDGLYNGKATIGPVNVLYDGTKLFVADWTFGFSVNIWNTIPTANCTASNSILGQPDATTRKLFYAGPEKTYFNAIDFTLLGDRLIVPDLFGSRALLWSPLPTGNTAADLALGVPSPSVPQPTPSPTTMYQAAATETDGTRVALADSGWNRVMLWNSIPTAANQPADVILGQPTTVAIAANTNGASAATLSGPKGVLIAENKLIVADSANNRVLIWNSLPTVTGTAADVVIGQVGFASVAANQSGTASARTLSNPVGLAYAGKKLFIADQNNHRILVFNSIPTIPNSAADTVLGQSTFATVSANGGGALSAASLNTPHGISADTFSLWVADSKNHRVLAYSLSTLTTGMNARRVYGQTDYTSLTLPSTPSEQSFLLPKKAIRKGQYLYILDAFNRLAALPYTP